VNLPNKYELLKSAGISSKTFDSLPRDVAFFIERCLILGIPNKSNCPFKPGDVVIKKGHNGNLISDSYGIVRKWVVTECPFGVVIGRIIAGKSKLGSEEVLNNPTKFNNHTIEMDQDYLDSLILDHASYDPFEKLSKSIAIRRKAAKYNKSISQRILTVDETVTFLCSLKQGDKIWSASTPLELTTNPNLDGVVFFKYKEPQGFLLIEGKGSELKTMSTAHIWGKLVTIKKPYSIWKVLQI
jgi:hypothetical protein